MRLFMLMLLPLLSIFVQSAFFSFYGLKGSFPDVLLIFVAFYALMNKSLPATAYGMLCGLLEDLYVGSMIGSNVIAKGATAYVISRLQVQVFKENLLVGVLGVFIASMVNAAIILLISLAVKKNLYLDTALLTVMGYHILYNMLLSVPAYLIYYNSSRYGWLMPVRKD